MPTRTTKRTNQQGLSSVVFTAPTTGVDTTAIIRATAGSEVVDIQVTIRGITIPPVTFTASDLALPGLGTDSPTATAIPPVAFTASDLALSGLGVDSPTATAIIPVAFTASDLALPGLGVDSPTATATESVSISATDLALPGLGTDSPILNLDLSSGLPSLPLAQQTTFIQAANTAATGQAYSNQDVIDTIASHTELWLDIPGVTFQDAGGATPSNVGDPIYRITGLKGLVDLVQPTAAAQFNRTANGWTSADGDFMEVENPQPTLKTATVQTVIVVQQTAINRYAVWVGHPHEEGVHASPFFRWVVQSVDLTEQFSLRVETDNPFTAAINRDAMSTYIYSTGDREFYVNGTSQFSGTGATVTYPNATRLRVGGNGVGGENFVGHFRAIMIRGSTYSATERDQVSRFLTALLGL